ncbi:retrovirus-related Pol polyprotein from transposon 412 [Trichonephila inaurata madagascariensis]|uniref:Retrovirus-related Pol polyprotein from transposon 412 n=1 Tax=Trichonephila inaurata madagascariensis TaxID=2747483 RepID=A0A8X6XA89_9ARAC|nr:retrovirus-related Pol polyprotein from transposon 412 [Trichonephila inaurata madagascariensis]
MVSELVECQINDPETQKFLHDKSSSLQLALKSCQSSDSEIVCDTSTATQTSRPIVHKSFRKLIFDQLRNISHPETATTTKLICARYVWPNMKREIRECVECSEPDQRSKVERHTKASLGLPDTQFREIHINILDPLPPSDGHICEENRPRLKTN